MQKNVLNTDLTGKVAVVTGAGGVLCSYFAKVLARAGAKVALLDLNFDAANQFGGAIAALLHRNWFQAPIIFMKDIELSLEHNEALSFTIDRGDEVYVTSRYIAALQQDFGWLHITSDEALTWNQIYQTIADALGVRLNPLYVSSDFLAFAGKSCGYDFEGSLIGDKSVSVVFDNSKIKRIVPDMHATVRFDQGIRIALDYIMKHPELQREDPAFDQFTDRVAQAVETARNAFR